MATTSVPGSSSPDYPSYMATQLATRYTAAANHAVEMGFLLPADRDALIAQAAASNVLVP